MKLSSVVFLLAAACAAFYFGFKTKEKEKEVQLLMLGQAGEAAKTYVKSEADVTKKWWNQLTNTWKQIWK